MSLPTELSPEAEADLEDAAVWHEGQSDGLGAELVSEVRNTVARSRGHSVNIAGPADYRFTASPLAASQAS